MTTTIANPTTDRTMSHLEIAKIANKRPDNVKRTIRALEEKDLISFTQFEETLDQGFLSKTVTNYYVSQRDSYVVMARVSPEFTARLVDRWQELETEKLNTTPMLPTTGNPVLDALVQTQLQVDANAIQLQKCEEKLEELTKPIEGVPTDVVIQQLAREGIYLSISVVDKVVNRYQGACQAFKNSKQKMNGKFYAVWTVDLEDTLEVIRVWFDECIHYDVRTNNRDFYHVETGIGGQYSKPRK